MFSMALGAIGLLFAFVAFICFVLVVIKMFQNGKTGLAILSIVLNCVVGLGSLIAFIVGFKNGKEWGTSKAATIGLVAVVISAVLFSAKISVDMAAAKRAFEAQQEEQNLPADPTLDVPDIPF